MTKKIWRGYLGETGGMSVVEGFQIEDKHQRDCTVVQDNAFFPVKEAMAVVSAMEAWYGNEDTWSKGGHTKRERDKLETNMCIAMGKFHVAQEKLMIKAGKKVR